MSWILMIIFGLISIICVVGTFQSIKDKNPLAILFHFGGAAIFGWFVIMTVINSGYPPVHH